MDKDTFKTLVKQTHAETDSAMLAMVDGLVKELDESFGDVKEHDAGMYAILQKWLESLRAGALETGTALKLYVLANYSPEGERLTIDAGKLADEADPTKEKADV